MYPVNSKSETKFGEQALGFEHTIMSFLLCNGEQTDLGTCFIL